VGGYGSEYCGRDVCAFDRNLYWNAPGRPILFGDKTVAAAQYMCGTNRLKFPVTMLRSSRMPMPHAQPLTIQLPITA
jgi:hypothetical protein